MMEPSEIVGSEWVLNSPEILASYSRDMSFAPSIKPRMVVMPKSSYEVKRIVEWANKAAIPLVPVSSGPPRLRGDTVPSIDGAVIVDLSRMKRIIAISRRHRIALVEPGVTFSEILPILEKEGLALLMPLMPRDTKSVVTSALECEPIIMPKYQWEAQDPLSCVEVIFGNGELFRTGEAVGPGDLEDQWRVGKFQTRGTGPAYVDFSKILQCAQGTIGIVTWASIRCKPLSNVRKAFIVPSESLNPLVELVYKLMWRRLGDICLILNNGNLACILEKDSDEITKLHEDLPPWILIFTIEPGGMLPREKTDYYEDEFINWARSFKLKPEQVFLDIKADDVAGLISNVSPKPYWKLRLKGGVQELFFLTTMDKTPDFVDIILKVADHHSYSASNIGIYIQPIVQGVSCHCEFDLYYDPEELEEVEKVKRVLYDGARAVAKAGAFFARPYWTAKDIVSHQVMAQVTAVQRRLKSIFDPNNVMNPGKLYFEGGSEENAP